MKKALITGITGQDGSYLAELLLAKGYEVHGIVKRETLEDPVHKMPNLAHIKNQIMLHEGSIFDHLTLHKIINIVKPLECYHLAAHSFVSYSLSEELAVMSHNFNSTHFILSTLRELRPECRFFLAGSSEMFGEPNIAPQNEYSMYNPKSIYGIAKVASSFLVRNYREKENIFACTGILYNHESARRGYQFVTRKITSTVAKISLGLENKLTLGNLDAKRDWGYAPEYVEAMWLMLQHSIADDFVISTGRLHSVREFLGYAFGCVGLNYNDYVEVDPKFYRPSEQIPLCGDSSKIKMSLNWQPLKSLQDIVSEMVENDIKLIKGKI